MDSFIASLPGLLNQAQFHIRQKYLGRIKLRVGLPQLQDPRPPDTDPDSDTDSKNPSRIFLNKYSPKYDESFYYSLLINQAISPAEAQEINQVIDIGCRNWSYADILAQHFPRAKLVGVEVDGYRRYWNLYRRMDFAYAYANRLRQKARDVEFIPADFSRVRIPLVDGPILFCFLFPFVSEYPCIQWGLPTSYSNFEALLQHSLRLISNPKTQPQWLSVHQGEWEAQEARRIYQNLGFTLQETRLPPQSWQGRWPCPSENYLLRAH